MELHLVGDVCRFFAPIEPNRVFDSKKGAPAFDNKFLRGRPVSYHIGDWVGKPARK